MVTHHRRWIGWILVVMMGSATLRVFWPGSALPMRTLTDGTTIALSDVTIGNRVEYVHGTWLERTIGRLAPSNGIQIGKLRLKRPDRRVFSAMKGSEALVVRFQLGSIQRQQAGVWRPKFYRQYRLIISGDDGFVYCAEFDRFEEYSFDDVVAFARTETFPRDSSQLHFRLERREKEGTVDWQEVSTFVVANPRRARVESWVVAKNLKFKLSPELEFEMGEVTVQRERIHPTDIWETMATLPFRVMRNGEIAEEWDILDGQIRDSSGNYESLVTQARGVTNGWVVKRTHRPLDPSKPWHFHINLSIYTNYPGANLHVINVECPISGKINTNVSGLPVEIGQNNEYLDVNLKTHLPNIRMKLVSVTDGQGTDIDDWSGNWGQYHFYKKLKLSSAKTQVKTVVAIVPNYSVDFIVQPRLEK